MICEASEVDRLGFSWLGESGWWFELFDEDSTADFAETTRMIEIEKPPKSSFAQKISWNSTCICSGLQSALVSHRLSSRKLLNIGEKLSTRKKWKFGYEAKCLFHDCWVLRSNQRFTKMNFRAYGDSSFDSNFDLCKRFGMKLFHLSLSSQSTINVCSNDFFRTRSSALRLIKAF